MLLKILLLFRGRSQIELTLLRWTFLPLFAVWVEFIDYIYATTAADNFVTLRRISFNRCSYFHAILKSLHKIQVYTGRAIFRKDSMTFDALFETTS